MRTRRSPIDDLRLAIDCLPERTRTAMLEGIAAHEIIVGAYSDRDGGVCPMLAAHRCGGRTSFISFARAWDAFADVKRARRATGRELRILRTQLEASLLEQQDCPPSDLGRAIQDHQAAARGRRAAEAAEAGGWGFLQRARVTREDERERERELVR